MTASSGLEGGEGHAVVLVTAPDIGVARDLARTLLEERLVACVNLVPKVESHYWWEGRVESGEEVLMMLKTTRALLENLHRRVRERHPYDTPEFLVMRLDAGSGKYLDWLTASCSRSGE